MFVKIRNHFLLLCCDFNETELLFYIGWNLFLYSSKNLVIFSDCIFIRFHYAVGLATKIERYSDKYKPRNNVNRPPLSSYLKLAQSYFPAELLTQGIRHLL